MSLVFEHRGFQFRSSSGYPRIRYFQARLTDVYSRFCRIVGNLPCHIPEIRQLQAIEQKVRALKGPPFITMFGDPVITLEDVVMDPKALREEERQEPSSPILCPAVCYIPVPDVGSQGQKILKLYLDTLAEYLKDLTLTPLKLFVVTRISAATPSKQRAAFGLFANGRIQQILQSQSNVELIIQNADENVLPSILSVCMEAKLMEMFDELRNFFDIYVPKRNKTVFGSSTPTIVAREILTKLFRDVKTFTDYCESPTTNEMAKVADDEHEILVSKIMDAVSRRIRCGMVSYFSETHQMQDWLLNYLFVAADLERKINDAVSATNKEKMRGICYSSVASPRVTDNLATAVAYDIDGILKGVESQVKALGPWCVSAKKMQHELKGYIRQSEAAPALVERTIDVPKHLQEDLSKLENVFGFGTIADKFEIHLKEEDKNCACKIEELMNKHKFQHDYAVKVVSQLPRLCSLMFEGGVGIKAATTGYSGTIGVFLQDHQGVLYGTTCGHVVCPPGRRDIFVKDRGNLVKLAESDAALTLTTGNSYDTLVDIAAMRVEPSMAHRCLPSLKNEDGWPKPTVLDQNQPGSKELELPFVYKYGAASNKTRGMICSAKYTVSKNEEFGTNSVIYIEDPPGTVQSEASVPFALPGDSGAVVCCSEPDGSRIRVVAEVLGGDFKLTGENESKYIACLFHKSVSALEQKSGKAFRLFQNARVQEHPVVTQAQRIGPMMESSMALVSLLE